jgi:hypothetical protein
VAGSFRNFSAERSGEVIAAVNIAIPWSPEPITDLVGQHTPALQAAARQIAAQVI